ncbi:hypothetical protein [Acinetobacter silvestris]|uniref:Calcineurin-like phosphoesterase domain-containing protein n=1 Tax=Acinetobacter silvestris TaxID=1977882 RepID=A0A1Y3CH02_9GAMM|nr:hypothetical protein [Acinetobacter silvestris]OTG66407.1 hypothetical protein B9T28_03885 [Acinetobacter silvestris]
MQVKNSIPWLKTQLEQAKKDNKYVILNLHNIEYYFGKNAKTNAEKVQSEKDKMELEDLLGKYSPNIRAIFVGHYHQEIGQERIYNLAKQIAGIPILYSGSPISGRFLKVEFDASNLKECIKPNKVITTPNGTTSTLPSISCKALNQ